MPETGGPGEPRGLARSPVEEAIDRLELALVELGDRAELLAPVEAPSVVGRLSDPAVGQLAWVVGMVDEAALMLEDLLETGTRYLICPSETDQKLFIEKIASRLDVTVRVNVDPGLFATGRWELLAPELERAASLAGLRTNTHVGSGVLPYETASELVIKARDYVSSL